MNQIEYKLKKIRESLSSGVELLAVSKTKPSSMIESAYLANQRHFGENKVQELLDKSQMLGHLTDIKWHFIGHLQSNKINQLLKTSNLVSIHSIDSSKLLNKLLSKSTDKRIGLFLQVNTSGETQKAGFESFDDISAAADIIDLSSSFYLQGLMTIGRIRTDDFEGEAHKSFKKLSDIKMQLGRKDIELSMGMSRDFRIAQEYGAQWVRIGSDIFGVR